MRSRNRAQPIFFSFHPASATPTQPIAHEFMKSETNIVKQPRPASEPENPKGIPAQSPGLRLARTAALRAAARARVLRRPAGTCLSSNVLRLGEPRSAE